MKSISRQNLTKLTTWVDVARFRASQHPDRLAYLFLEAGETEAARLTYGELDRQARAIAVQLRQVAGIGDRALLLHPQGLELLVAFVGCLYAGIIAVPAFPPPRRNRNRSRLQAIQLDSQPKLGLVKSSQLENAPAEFPSLRWLATDTISPDLAEQWREPEINGETLAFLQYTSGSTGTPKGVMVTHKNLLHNEYLIQQGFEHLEGIIGVSWLPLFHDMGLVGGALQPFYVGGTCILMSPVAFLQQPTRWLRAISKYRGSSSGSPNFAYELVCRHATPELLNSLDLSSWEIAFNGAEPIRPETMQKFAETFAPCGFRESAFYPCYGMAETTLFVSGSTKAKLPITREIDPRALLDNRVILGSRGQAIAGCGRSLGGEVAIVDPKSLTQCQSDRVGEIWVASGSVARGYWNRPEETERTFQAYLADTGEGPFLRTGDLGFIDNGELFITGRLKDLVIIRGRNYYPQDLEQTVEAAHSALRPSCGAAFSIEIEGEEKLVIVQEIDRACRRRFDRDEVIEAIRRAVAVEWDLQVYAIALLETASIPKTSSGKIQRRACKQGFLDKTLAAIGEWTNSAAEEPAEFSSESEERSQPPTMDEIQAWLTERIAQTTQVAPRQIDPQQPFSSYGIDSVTAVGLSGELEQWLQQRLSPTLLYDYPTIAQLAHRLAFGEALSAVATPTSGTAEPSEGDAIAIVGLSCRFPGAENPQAFWQLLHDGVDAITEVPRDRWDADAYYADTLAPGKMTTRWGGFLDAIDRFDAPFFEITPREAAKMDPQQRLLLEVAWEALEAAGQPPQAIAGSRVGVFVGTSGSDYMRLMAGDRAPRTGRANREGLDAYVGTGNAASIAANRLSYSFDWRGPSLAVDTACSSSLVAVHLAGQSLRLGECDLALAGGVNVLLAPDLTIAFSQARLMASDGRCKAFDASADGYVRGEGCGLVVLERLSDARRNGHPILAIVRGSAIAQDGRSNGLSAPNGPAQQAVIRQALANAGVTPEQIQYVEAHGTGTALGDPVEMGALQSVFGSDRALDPPCLVGSVKTNIGHLEAAAGIAGLIKVVLALQHREIPPHLHLQQLNPHINLESVPLAIATQGQPWTTGEKLRLAGVSSFGFGGTNAHVVLQEAPAVSNSPISNPRERPLHLLALAAKSNEALRQLSQRYAELTQTSSHGLADVCYSANTGRSHFSHRQSFVASSKEDLHAQLHTFASTAASRDGQSATPKAYRSQTRIVQSESPKVAFLFSGQGTQWVGMGQQLYQTQPTFREAIDRCEALLQPELERSLLSVLYPDHPSEDSPLHQTAYTQPALFACEYALAQLWQSWGIEPSAVMGHSIGEYVAACVAGVFSLEAGLKLVAARGRLMQSLPEDGAMLAVAADADLVASMLATENTRIAIAAINGAHNTVVSGDRAAVEAIAERVRATGIKTKFLQVSHGFHSPLIEPILNPFRQVVAQIEFAQPQIEGVGNLTADPPGSNFQAACGGAFRTGDSVSQAWTTPEYWVEHLRSPVQFARGMETLYKHGCRTFLEVGPKPTLLAMGRQCFTSKAADSMQWLASLQPGRGDWQVLLESLGALYESGADIDWRGFDRDYQRQQVPLPTYPFQRQSYWFAPRESRTEISHPLLGRDLEPSPQQPGDRCWEIRLSPERLSYLGEHRVWGKPILFLSAYAEMALAAARSAWGQECYQLRNLQLYRPLFFEGEQDYTVQISLSQKADGSASFQARSRPSSTETTSPWVLHATATLHRDAIAPHPQSNWAN